MARAAETPQESVILGNKSLLTFKSGDYFYRIEKRGDQSIYSVSNGKETLEVPIGWAVGAGRIGQTYVFQKDGEYYESRVSYFKEIDGLDITIGHQDIRPKTLIEAAGKKVAAIAAMNCFNCHATDAVENGKLTLPRMEPGLRCVRCHEAAPKHLAGLSQGELDLDEMKKLKLMSPEQTITFCGQCHRTAVDVKTDAMDLNTVRFAPYRLTLSKCYDPGDKRITCTACHDPHQEVGVQQVDYDSKCQACHVAGKSGVSICKVATKNCTSCHMAKIDLPGAHHRFTDHWIRVDKATVQRASK